MIYETCGAHARHHRDMMVATAGGNRMVGKKKFENKTKFVFDAVNFFGIFKIGSQNMLFGPYNLLPAARAHQLD